MGVVVLRRHIGPGQGVRDGTIRGMCPHARPHWQMCPWCLGVNDLPPPSLDGVSFEYQRGDLGEVRSSSVTGPDIPLDKR